MGDISKMTEKAKEGENIQAEAFAKDILGFEEILDDEDVEEERIGFEKEEINEVAEEGVEEEQQESQMKGLSLEESNPK